jgi:VanZ family protein
MIHPLNFRSGLIKTLGWLIIGVLFAFAMEAVQYFLPYRAFNINDLLANGLGVVL